MGLFKAIKGQLINVIEWTDDDGKDLMVYRFPVDNKEIKNGAQLTVRDSQVAIFVNEGQIADVFTPGRYKLTTENLPVLTKLQAWKYGFNSPFKCEVYFVNTKQFTGLKWGTSNPFSLRDADFGICRIRAFGTYALQVADAALFYKEAFATNQKYTVRDICDYVKSIVVSAFTDFLAETKMPVLDIPTMYNEIGEGTTNKVTEKLSTMGLKVKDIVVENISLPDAVEKAIDERSSMSALGNMNTYTQYKAANAISDAAKNPGGMAGAGASMGAGLGFGAIMANAMGQATAAQNQAQAQVKEVMVCSKCGAKVPSDSKFCPECGNKMTADVTRCIKCGAEIKVGTKFCPECGASQVAVSSVCPKCNAKVKAGAKFCPECGEKLS